MEMDSSDSSGHSKALKILSATFFSWRDVIGCLLWRLFSSICMLWFSVFCQALLCSGSFGFRFSGAAATLVNLLGIVNAMMKDAVEDPVEALGDLMQVFQRQFAFIQLAVGKDAVDDVLDHALDTVGGRID